MKPRMFVASSAEQIEYARAIQEELEHDAEITVWNQGVFQLSKTALASLIIRLGQVDFGVFLFAPDDVMHLRDRNVSTVRDNVIFELGLFIGRLGEDRCFIVAPRGVNDLHLPTDLLGLNLAFFETSRQDGNKVAALGVACNQIRRILKDFAQNRAVPSRPILEQPKDCVGISDENDCISMIQSWMGARPSCDNSRVIKFDDVDRELGLQPGSARKYLKIAAKHWGYTVEREGWDTILLKDRPDRNIIAF